MKNMLKNLLLPAAIVFSLLLLMSASFLADDIITSSYNEYVSVFSQDVKTEKIVLIIDPGHGGADGGAVSVTDGKESEINLSIATKAEQIAAFFGVITVTTRDSENIDYPPDAQTIRQKKVYDSKTRVELISSTDNAVLLSIHQNNFGDASVSGAQVFYRNADDSFILADSVTGYLSANVVKKCRNPELIADDIYIFKNISCPAIMIECGFLSNYDENELLNRNEYQTKLSLAMISGYLSCEDQLIDNYFGGTNESQDSLLLY